MLNYGVSPLVRRWVEVSNEGTSEVLLAPKWIEEEGSARVRVADGRDIVARVVWVHLAHLTDLSLGDFFRSWIVSHCLGLS